MLLFYFYLQITTSVAPSWSKWFLAGVLLKSTICSDIHLPQQYFLYIIFQHYLYELCSINKHQNHYRLAVKAHIYIICQPDSVTNCSPLQNLLGKTRQHFCLECGWGWVNTIGWMKGNGIFQRFAWDGHWSMLICMEQRSLWCPCKNKLYWWNYVESG